MTRSPDFKMDFFTKDFLSSTATWTGPEAAAYALALIFAWTQGAALSADPERIRKALHYDPRDWRKVWPALEPKFPLTADGTARRNPREVERWNEESARAAKASEHGKKGAGGRWPSESPEQCPSNAPAMPGAMPEQWLSPSPSPSPSEEKEKEKREGAARPSHSGFSPPSIEEVQKEVAEKGSPVDPETFLAHYTANGWVQASGRPIKDWRAAIVTWTKREKDRGGNGQPRVVIHKNQGDLDRAREGDEIRRNREADARRRREQDDDDVLLGEVLEEKAREAEKAKAPVIKSLADLRYDGDGKPGDPLLDPKKET